MVFQIEFNLDLKHPPHVKRALDRLCSPLPLPTKEPGDDYLLPLTRVADTLGAKNHALANASRLAHGAGDLVVLLLEPSDLSEKVPYDKLVDECPALKILDDYLRWSSKGVRNLDNTCVLHVRPFRSDEIRQNSPKHIRLADDEVAYTAFEEILESLQPDVLLVWQCDTSKVGNDLAKELSSSVGRAGDLGLLQVQCGKQIIVVDGFHPSHVYEHTDRWVYRWTGRKDPLFDILEWLLKLSMLTAINAVRGRLITGNGTRELQKAYLSTAGKKEPARGGSAIYIKPLGPFEMKLSLLDRVHRRLEFEKALEVLEEKYERNGGGEKGKDTPAGLSTD